MATIPIVLTSQVAAKIDKQSATEKDIICSVMISALEQEVSNVGVVPGLGRFQGAWNYSFTPSDSLPFQLSISVIKRIKVSVVWAAIAEDVSIGPVILQLSNGETIVCSPLNSSSTSTNNAGFGFECTRDVDISPSTPIIVTAMLLGTGTYVTDVAVFITFQNFR